MGGGGQVRPAKSLKLANPAREQKELNIPALGRVVFMYFVIFECHIFDR